MWVNRKEYLELIAQRAAQASTVQWLIARVNQLEKRNAMLEMKAGLPPTEVPEIVMPTPSAVSSFSAKKPDTEPPSMRDIFAGNINFEDMGDENARRLGIE